MRAKVTIVGAGMTGGTMAQRLIETGYIDVVLQDIIEGMPQGKALDLAESGPHVAFNATITGSNDWANTKGSDVVVITSGMPRKPGMTREELLNVNAGIVRDVATAAFKESPDAVFIIFANPMDAMCHVTLETTGLPSSRVIGQGGMLDSARYRTFLAWESGASVQDVHAIVLGGHTEATMVPIVSTSTIGGVPLTAAMPQDKIDASVARTKNGGAEIVSLLKTGSAFYAPAAATSEMVEAVLLDKKRVLPCAVKAEGQFGIKGAFVGLPVKLGAGGIEQVYEPLEALAWVAAHTKTIRLGTSVLDIPFYNPVMFARRVSSIDQLSGGRLTLGLGLGWSEDEMEASGANMKVRGQRADEFLEVLHAIWKDDPAEYSGKHFKLASSTILPKPAQKPHPPIYLAAYAPAAMSRVARLADGWIPAGVPVDGMGQMFSGIQNMAKEAGRDPSELKMIVRANLEVRSEPRGDQGFVFSGTRDEIKADIAAVRELGAEELHFDPSFDVAGGSVQGFLDTIELVRELAG